MIIWRASYPKSGNTYIRSFLSAYYFTKDGKFNFEQLKNIQQYPDTIFFNKKINDFNELQKNYLSSQKNIFDKKKGKFLKTHNIHGLINGNNFTNSKYTLGVVYIVRDPRNILNSMTNFYNLTKEKAFQWMTNPNMIIFHNRNDYSTYQLISSWSNNYRSWRNASHYERLFVRYEDLKLNKYKIFREIIIFTNRLLKIENGLDEIKLKNAIETTDFEKLKKMEKSQGFEEATQETKSGKKNTFFNLGFENNWEKNSNLDIYKEIENQFSKEMKELGYLK